MDIQSKTITNISHLNNNTTSVESLGIRLTTRPPTSVSNRLGYEHEHKDSDKTIQEHGWTLSNMLERFSFINSYQWTATQSSHSVVAKLRIPQDLIVNKISFTPFDTFTYWRGDVELQIQVTATPFHQGMVAAVFIPLTTNNTAVTNIISNFSALSVNQTCYLFANANTAAVMNIPFNSPQHYLNLATGGSQSPENALGHLYIVVFNQLQLSASASDTATVSVFSRFLNNEFKVPRLSTTSIAIAQSKTRKTHHNVIAQIADTVLPDMTVADAIDKAGDFLSTMLDKPTDVTLQNPAIFQSNGRMNFSRGVEFLDKLSLDPSQIYPVTTETFATHEDEMSYEYLKKKYSYLGSFTFSTTDLPGKVLASFPMNPFPSLLKAGQISQIPLLSYISIPFCYYKGGFTYKLQIISTSLQTGKIFAAFNFGSYTVPTTLGVNNLTSQYGEAFEINQGSNTIEFSVPYVATTPYKRIPTSNVPSEEDSLGYLNFVVLNSLVAPNNTPTSIVINVFIAGNDDYHVSTLSDGNNVTSVNYLATPGVTKISDDFEMLGIAQSTTVPITPIIPSEIDMATESLVAPNDHTEERPSTTQRSPLNIRDILKKYQMVPTQIRTLNSITTAQGGVISAIKISAIFGAANMSAAVVNPTLNVVDSLFSLYSPMFRMYRGSLRFKIIKYNSSTSFCPTSVFYEPPVQQNAGVSDSARLNAYARSLYVYNGASNTYNGSTISTKYRQLTRLPVSYATSFQKSLEFEVPFTSLYAAVLASMGDLAENFLTNSPLFDLGNIIVYQAPLANFSELFDVFVSFSDESRFGVLYNVPPVLVNAATDVDGVVTGSAYPDNYPTTSPNTNTLYRL